MNRPHFAGFLVGTLFLGVTLTLAIQHVRAAGIPQTSALTYSGYLASADGTPVNTPQAVNLYFYNAATGGSPLCQVVPGAPTTVASGRFQIQLPPECTEQVKQNPDLWIEVHVGGIPLGRTKLGAVPYAVEAGHAKIADTANAIGCEGASSKLNVCTNSKAAVDALITTGTDGHHLRLSPSLCQGCFNGINQAGDVALVYSNGAIGTGALTIAPWADAISGIRMTANGYVGIGTANPAYPLDVNGQIRASNVSVTSDERLKVNIKSIENPLGDLSKLRGVRFNWKKDGSKSIGIVAQDVERVYPELVSTAADGSKAVDYDKLIAVVIESSKALALQNSELQRDNAALHERMARIERQLDRLSSK